MKIVISGVNLVEGGPLKVFKDAIIEFSRSNDVDLICLVHKKSLFSDLLTRGITFIEFPEVKASWLKRIKFEYLSSLAISRDIKPDIWLSMHDMSANVDVPIQFVYCHNPSPFYKSSIKELKYEPKLYFFSLFYKWLYKINIRANDAVIVQQDWIGQYLVDKLKAKDYLVAIPSAPFENNKKIITTFKNKIKFFYPALARTFKNFELILNAMVYLKENFPNIYSQVEVNLTIEKTSNKYASSIIEQFGHLDAVNFLGMLSYKEVVRYYNDSDIVLFPSKLETWGLPISEAKEFSKPIILADLPYAYETLGSYNAACFVDVNDAVNLANKIKDVVDGGDIFSEVRYEMNSNTLSSWAELVKKIKSSVV